MERSELARHLGALAPQKSGGAQIVEDEDSIRFMGAFRGALSVGGNIFLVNPAWRSQERAALDRLAGADDCGDRGWLMIPSGGSSGGLKFARHDGWTVAAAVDGFQRHFGMQRVNALGLLPLYHVSGFMAWMRSALTGGTYLPGSWKEIEAGRYPEALPDACCLSLVPTQLQRLLSSASAVAWLKGFRVVFVGGGPAWSSLLEEAVRQRIPLAPCYGATETAAMVASLKPEQFLGGLRGCGSPLPHARIDLVQGVVRISGDSLYRGYYPDWTSERSWTTEDMGEFTPEGSLVIFGRRDDMIVSGGKKVSPAEVEGALRLSGEFSDLAVIGVPDLKWGQAVVACYPAGERQPRTEKVDEALSALASFKRPKRYVAVSPWPRNAQGKIDRASLQRFVAGK